MQLVHMPIDIRSILCGYYKMNNSDHSSGLGINSQKRSLEGYGEELNQKLNY